MRILRALTQTQGKAAAALTAAAVAAAGVGLYTIDVQASAFREQPPAQTIPAVPAVAWAPGSGTLMVPFLTGAQDAGTGAKVDGTAGTAPSRPASAQGPAEGGQAKVTTAALLRSQVFPKLAVPAANPGGAGDFTALPGTGAGQWGVAGQTGSFTWSYPLTGRAAPAGPSPSLAFAYDSSSVDGLTSSTNNQASTVGDGWNLAGLGTIRQRFAPCMDQGVANSYDLCGNPGGQSLSISFGGRSGMIVKDAATGAYHLAADDGTKVEYLTASGQNGTFDGGYWKLTDTSGTQYFFGRNKLPGWASGSATTNSADTVPVGAANSSQPCTAGSFGASLCQQAYAWNLDYAVDTHGNSEAVYYAQDTNWYASQAGTGANLQYVRTSRPSRVDYGMRSGSELTASAPLQYTFAYTGRCTGVDCSKGTDVPTGLSCASTGTCATQSPTFYTDQRLQTVTAQALVGTVYQGADSWALAHAMPDPGDGTKPALWLGSVTHTGANTAAGTAVTDPATTFAGQTLQNRVMVADGLAPLDRYRLSSITAPTGSVVSVSYMGQECSSTNLPASPQTNTKRCFPQWWAPSTPIAQAARMDYFHIYPVAAVGVSAGPGGNGSVDTLTSYQYLGAPAYRYAAPKYVSGSGGSQLTWSVLAGWGQVKTITGNDSGGANPTTTTTYLRGLDGTPADTSGGTVSATVTTTDGTAITDSPWFAGATVETQTFLGTAGGRLTDTTAVPWASAPTATGTAGVGSPTARHTGTAQATTSEASSQSGGTRSRTVKTTYDSQGRPTSVSSGAETGTTGTASCVLTAYADNTGANLLALPATVSTRAGECAADGTSTGDILAATATLYDSSTSAVPGSSGYTQPTKGEATRTDTATASTGGTVTAWLQGPSRTFDALGRILTSTDSTTGTARTTTTAYSPATGLPTTITTTNPLGWQASQTLDAVRGQVLTATDANGYATTNVYDSSGRLTKTWDPLRPQATYPSTPTKAVTYSVSQTAPSWIRTDTVNSSGSAYSVYTVYDGAGRVRQTQRSSPTGGTIATNTFYSSAGQVSRVDNDYLMSANPSGTLMIPTLAVPSSTTYAYDGAGRTTVVTAVANDNQNLWATTTSYTGADTTTVTGPGNATATQTVTGLGGDVLIRNTFHGTTATGTPDTTAYAFDALGRAASMKDTAGNIWSWGYDTAGRQTTSADPDTGTTTTAYDASGRVATTTDANGTATGYQYDTLDRATTVTAASSGGAAKTLISRTYDTLAKGQLTSATRYNGPNFDQAVTTAYSGYNAAYEPKTVTTTLPSGMGPFAASYAISALYGQSGKVTKQALPALGGLASETLTYGWSSYDTPSTLGNNSGDIYAGGAQYNSLGLLGSFQQYDSNGATRTNPTTGVTTNSFTWDATTGRLTNQSSTNTANGQTVDLGKTTYTYTPAGLTTGVSTTWSGRPGAPTDNQCYAYDYANRLAAAWTPTASTDCNTATAPATNAASIPGLAGPAPYAQTYTYTPGGDRSQVRLYDAAGNLATTEAYTYQGTGHQLATLTTTPATGNPTAYSFSWNAAGQMTSLAGQTLTYTPDGKLAATTGTSTLPANLNPSAANGTPPGPTATGNTQRYYTADGTLVGITDATGTALTLGATTAHANTAGAQTATRTYTFAGKAVAQRTAAGSTTQLAFMTSDRNNTATTLTYANTSTQGITTYTRYTDPWGNARGTTQTAIGTAAYSTAPATARGTGSNDANPAGFSAANGYIGGLADPATTFTHLGARELNPVLGAFTAPDPILNTGDPNGFSAYAYSAQDPINHSDSTGLDYVLDDVIGFAIIAGIGLIAGWVQSHPVQFNNSPFQLPWDHSSPMAPPDTPSVTANPGASVSFSRPGVSSFPAAPQAPAISSYPSAQQQAWTSSYPAHYQNGWTSSSPSYGPARAWVSNRPTEADPGAEQARAMAILKAQNEQLKAASDAATQNLGHQATAEAAASANGVASVPKAGRRPTAAVRRAADAAATDENGVLRCQACGVELVTPAGAPNSREFDHIFPYSRGGGRGIDNIWDLCRTCNRQKGASTLDEWDGSR